MDEVSSFLLTPAFDFETSGVETFDFSVGVNGVSGFLSLISVSFSSSVVLVEGVLSRAPSISLLSCSLSLSIASVTSWCVLFFCSIVAEGCLTFVFCFCFLPLLV